MFRELRPLRAGADWGRLHRIREGFPQGVLPLPRLQEEAGRQVLQQGRARLLRQVPQGDRASNEGYPKIPEDFTIMEKAPTRRKGHKGRVGWLALIVS